MNFKQDIFNMDSVNSKMHIDRPELAFFTADPHFFHESIINLCNRPFKNAHEMNETMIANWNAVVPPIGTVFILGDMFWKTGNIKDLTTVMNRLHGNKILVKGNHDLLSDSEYEKLGFTGVYNYLELTIEKQKLACFHYPILEWAGFYKGSWHLYGHVHGRGNHFSKRVLDVGMDCNYFTPLRWNEIKRKLAGGFEKDMEKLNSINKNHKHDLYIFKD